MHNVYPLIHSELRMVILLLYLVYLTLVWQKLLECLEKVQDRIETKLVSLQVGSCRLSLRQRILLSQYQKHQSSLEINGLKKSVECRNPVGKFSSRLTSQLMTNFPR